MHRADVFYIVDDPVWRYLRNVHSVDGFSRKIIDMLKVEYRAFLHLVGREVITAMTGL